MPVHFPPSGYGYTLVTTTKAGVTVTAGGTAHTMGAWTTVLSSLAFDCYALLINVFDINVAGGDSRYLVDIGVSEGAGTERVVVPYLDVGGAAASAYIGRVHLLPLYIPAGRNVVVRGQSVTASKTCTVVAHALGLPFHGFSDLVAPQTWFQYGAVPGESRGVPLTSVKDTYGTAVSVGTTTRDHRLWTVGIDWYTNTAVSQGRYRVRLSRDSAGSDVIGIFEFTAPTANEDILGPFPITPVYRPLPSGTTLYVACDGAAAEAMSAVVYAA